MTVTSIDKDMDTRTLTVTATLNASVSRAWQLWDDPRQLERWWGPPTYPATVEDHRLVPGGGVTYYMTSPEGARHRGWWRIISVDPPNGLEFEDGFADETGAPNEAMPTIRMLVSLEPHGGDATMMTITSTFDSAEAMEQLATMGMVEGLTLALGQIDGLLLEAASR